MYLSCVMSAARDLHARLRSRVAQALETGTAPFGWAASLVTSPVSSLVSPLRACALARPLALPPGIAVVTVGGATLGGSGKTRVALACTRALAVSGRRVVLVGHGYRARRSIPRVVGLASTLAEVGDEALACALALDGIAPVVVGSSRAQAMAHAASLRPDAIVVDGPLVTKPERAALSLLAVDAESPWGSGVLVPAGDLRAPPSALVAAADYVVPVETSITSRSCAVLSQVRFGVFTALARPRRLLRSLELAGLVPAKIVAAPDHGPVTSDCARRLRKGDVDLWVTTPKCAMHLAALSPSVGAPIHVLDDACGLPARVEEALAHVSWRVRRAPLPTWRALTLPSVPQ